MATTTPYATAIISATAAVLVALIAARTAARRQAQQQQADARQAQLAREAEATAQRRELAHRRQLAELADLRILLDTTAVALSGVKLPFTIVGASRDDQVLTALAARLRVRLGPTNSVTVAFAEAHSATAAAGSAAGADERQTRAFLMARERFYTSARQAAAGPSAEQAREPEEPQKRRERGAAHTRTAPRRLRRRARTG